MKKNTLLECPIRLTERAATHIKSWWAKEDNSQAHPEHGLRIGVKSTGCSGYQYVVAAAERIDPQDALFQSRGVDIVIDPLSLRYLRGSELDFVKGDLQSNFRFSNPNVQETCGCGESFNLKEKLEQ
ncbi:MAG: HesB/IscA family protein [Candidatus Eutrophobiaceae bacterium]